VSGYLNYVGADLPEPTPEVAQETDPKPVRRKVTTPKEK
jgi:hypothetical protein